MPDPIPKLRLVGEGEPPPGRRKGPGPAVILVGLYALLFGSALWVLRGQALHRPRPANPQAEPAGAAAGAPEASDRKALLSGAGLEPKAREQYARSLAADCCDCGCDLTIRACLAGEQKCARSAQMAKERRDRLR